MNHFSAIAAIIGEILDVDPDSIRPETFLIRDLGAESIDLLEIGVAIQHRLGVAVDDATLLLKPAPAIIHQHEPDGADETLAALARAYPHLGGERLARIPADMAQGPILQVADLLAYVRFATENGRT